MKRALLFILISVVVISGCSRQEPVKEYRPPEFSGTVYVLPEGADHLSVLSLQDSGLKSLKIVKPAKQILKTDKGDLYILHHDGSISLFDLEGQRMVKTYKVGVRLCGGAFDDKGRIWVTDVGGLLLFDPSQGKVIQRAEAPEGVCGVVFDRNRGTLHLIDGKKSLVYVFDLKSLKVIDRISSVGNSVHLGAISPSGDAIWLAEGNEYREGRPYGVGFAKSEAMPGGINVVDLNKKAIVDFIFVGGNTVDIRFSADGRYAFTVSSQMAEYDDASLAVIDVNTRRVIKTYSLCKPCHVSNSVVLEKAFVRSLALGL